MLIVFENSYLIVDTSLPNHGDENVVSLPDNLDTLRRQVTNNSDADARAGEGVAHDELLVDAKLTTELADLVLEELSEGLDQLETLAVHHTGRQTTNVVVGLDGSGRALPAERLNQIGVKGALKEPFDLSSTVSVLGLFLNPDGFLLEQVDEGLANDLALGLGLSHASKTTEEKLSTVDNGKVNVEMLRQRLLDLRTLVETHQASVDKDGVESVANGLLHEASCDSAVDTSRNGTNDLGVLADKVADADNLLLDEVLHLPVVAGLANLGGKVVQDLSTAVGVVDLGVELDSENGLLLVGDASVGRVLGAGNGDETLGQVDELIEMAHEDVHGLSQALKEAVDVVLAVDLEDGEVSLTILTGLATLDVLVVDAPSELLATVANSENRDSQVENSRVHMRRNLVIDGRGTSTEDDTDGLPAQLGQLGGAGQHLSVDIEGAQTSQDEMAGLATKVEHQDSLTWQSELALGVSLGRYQSVNSRRRCCEARRPPQAWRPS